MAFFHYQRRILAILLAWGLGNMVVSPLVLLRHDPFWRQFGLQAFVWGAIDALLALAGRRQAVRDATHYAEGKLDDTAVQHKALGLRRILLINAGLDVLYVLSGYWVAQKFRDRPNRRGLGLGILVQGAFLLIYDLAMARDVDRRWCRDR